MLQPTNPNRKAFLDAIAWSEIGPELLAKSANGYNILVGSTPAKPLLFVGYADHPRVLNQQLHSTAAGRYQLLAKYFDYYRKMLGLIGFYPPCQDAIALQQIKECQALDLVDAGHFSDAMAAVASIWASLPGSPYGQHTNTIHAVMQAYLQAGGTLAPNTTDLAVAEALGKTTA